MLHVERIGIKFYKKQEPKEKKIMRCMLCNLLYNYSKHRDGCPNCLKGDPRLSSLTY